MSCFVAPIADHGARDRNPEEHLQKLHRFSEKLEHLKKGLPKDAAPMLVHWVEFLKLLLRRKFLDDDFEAWLILAKSDGALQIFFDQLFKPFFILHFE